MFYPVIQNNKYLLNNGNVSESNSNFKYADESWSTITRIYSFLFWCSLHPLTWLGKKWFEWFVLSNKWEKKNPVKAWKHFEESFKSFEVSAFRKLVWEEGLQAGSLSAMWAAFSLRRRKTCLCYLPVLWLWKRMQPTWSSAFLISLLEIVGVGWTDSLTFPPAVSCKHRGGEGVSTLLPGRQKHHFR